MPVLISMLRGINNVGSNRVKMDALRALYESLGFQDPRTCVQSGNVIFRTRARSHTVVATRIQDGIGRAFGFRPAVLLRTADELRKTVAANPFARRRNVEPSKFLVTFLAGKPAPGATDTLTAFKHYPEEIHLKGRELYIYFPNGVGESKLPWSSVEKLLGVAGTARNWNSVTKILAIAESLEAGK